MSFSGDVKREIQDVQGAARHCLIAEIAAILSACGHMSFEPPALRIHTESEIPCKKVFTLLQKAFNIKVDMRIEEQGGGYTLFVDTPAHVYTVMSAVGLIRRTEDGWQKLDAAEPRITERSCCKRAYIRGAFLSSGSVNDPNKTYHMEFVVDTPEKAERLRDLLLSFDVEAHILVRTRFSRQIYVVYLKDGSQIADVLTVIGAPKARLQFEDIRVVKDVRNQINRKVNCEAANLERVVGAAVRQIEDLQLIEAKIGLKNLPPNLREAAEVRLANQDASLQELAGLLGIGKSGVNHRLRKLSAMADELRE